MSCASILAPALLASRPKEIIPVCLLPFGALTPRCPHFAALRCVPAHTACLHYIPPLPFPLLLYLFLSLFLFGQLVFFKSSIDFSPSSKKNDKKTPFPLFDRLKDL